MTMKPTQSQWYLNCNRTWSSPETNTTINSSLINSTTTTPFWDLKTTTTAGNLSTIMDIEVMVSVIFGMVMVIILYATVYKLLGCNGSDDYHDTFKDGAEHVALTLFTFTLYLFDTLSDVLLFLQYLAIGQVSNFLLVAATTLAPVLFLELTVVAKKYGTREFGFAMPSRQQIFSMIVGLVLVLMSIPLAALIPTLTYAQVLATGKDNSGGNENLFRFGWFASYLSLIEATLESAPQLTLQIYLSITDTYTDIDSTRFIRYLSIVGSSLALAWSLTAFSHQKREENGDQEDTKLGKFLQWISRFGEIVPRIILIALITAEYSGYVMLFIVYRLLFAIIYTVIEIRTHQLPIKLTILPHIVLGIIGNIFCFSVLHIYKLQDKEHYRGKFFAGYYILLYAENGGLLYLWYSDDPVLLQIKIGGACSNHEWFLPYVFVVVILGFLIQPSFLYLYYRFRDKRGKKGNVSRPAQMQEAKLMAHLLYSNLKNLTI